MDGVKVSAGKETKMGLTGTGQAWPVWTEAESTEEGYKFLKTFLTPATPETSPLDLVILAQISEVLLECKYTR